MNQKYQEQMTLLLEVLPVVFQNGTFVLKGGTAINLFIQDFPRLSVDIDLTYMPLENRQKTLNGIQRGLLNIKSRIEVKLKEICIREKYNKKTKTITRLDLIKGETLVKVEPNLILRGAVFPVEKMDLHPKAQQVFKKGSFSIPISNKADLYGGKLCAALDRQHPRDLFDVKVLLDQGGITEEIKQAFLFYLCSHNRPIHELLNPNFQDQSQVFVTEFQGMENIPVSYQGLEETRKKLVSDLKTLLNNNDKLFLHLFKQGKLNWDLIGLRDLSDMPGIKWKQINLSRMDQNKRKDALVRLEKVLYGSDPKENQITAYR